MEAAPKKQITKKQHFVPQFYLRNFTDQAGQLHIFDVENKRRSSPKGPSSVCHEHFFYAEETGSPDDLSQEIEAYFAQDVEDPLSRELPELITKIRDGKQVSETDKYALAILMNHMWLRGPAMRAMINRTSEVAVRKISQFRYSSQSIDDELRTIATKSGAVLTDDEIAEIKSTVLENEYDLNFSNAQHLRFMLDSEHIRGFANLFFGQYWILYINRSNRQFITSTNPVTVILPERKSFYGPTFLERTHLFPLAPDILIETRYPLNHNGKKLKRETLFKGSESKVDELNFKIASQAQYVYSSRPDEIEVFENFVRFAQSNQMYHLLRQIN